MGGSNSKPEQDGDQTLSPEEILEENTHYPSPDSPYPFFVVQLSETEELPYKGQYVSDIIADYISKNRVTHLLLQTHGWNTPRKSTIVPHLPLLPLPPPPSPSTNPILIRTPSRQGHRRPILRVHGRHAERCRNA